MVGRILEYYCPACGKTICISPIDEINESVFKDSKQIDLTKYPSNTFLEHFPSILEHIYNNIDLYYDENTSENELEKSILSLVEEEQVTKN